MSLKVRFRFDGRCSMHPRYNPEEDGRPQSKDCAGCESLYVIYLYSRIARSKAESGDGLSRSRRVKQTTPEGSSAEQQPESTSLGEPE